MKMTKELKKVLLEGFEEMLNNLWSCEGWAQRNENEGHEQIRDYWIERRRNQQTAILKGIEGLIEEGE